MIITPGKSGQVALPGAPPKPKPPGPGEVSRNAPVNGVLVLFAQSRSSQQLNREEARSRLAELIRAALVRPKARVKTRPTKASKERRLTAKRARADVNSGRGRVRDD